MSNPKPDNMPWVIPYLAVENVASAIKHYQEIFGFEIIESKKGEDGQIFHAEMRYKDQVVMCGALSMYPEGMKTPQQGGFQSPVCLYVYVDDVDAMYEKVLTTDLKIQYEIGDQFWGDRMFACIDHDGYAWSFGAKITNT